MKEHTGPTSPIMVGERRVRVYPVTSNKRGRKYFGLLADLRSFGFGRPTASTREALEAKVLELVGPLADQHDTLTLRGARLREYERAMKITMPLGLELDEAMQRLRKYDGLANEHGYTLDSAVEFYHRHHSQEKHATPIPELIHAFIESKRKAGNSVDDLRDLKSHLRWFADQFKCPLRDVTLDDYDKFFAGFEVSAKTLSHYRSSVSRLVNWAKASRYVADSYPRVPSNLSKVKFKQDRQPLLTRREREKCLEVVHDNQKPALLLAAYAPCRTCELDRADFEDINWSNSTLAIYSNSAKTGVARFVYLVPELVERLQPYRTHTGKISLCKSLSKLWPRLAKRAGVQWRKNGWRKAVLSYLVAYTQNYEGTAAQGGTSVAELKHTYVSAVDFKVGGEWFGLETSDLHPLRPVSVQVNDSRPQNQRPTTEPALVQAKHLPLQISYAAH